VDYALKIKVMKKLKFTTYENWYFDINKQLFELSKDYNLPFTNVVGAFVSLSGQKKLMDNWIQTNELLKYGKCKTGMFSGAQIRAANRCLNGETPFNVWSKNSLKYRNFYKSIINPNCRDAVCIDSILIQCYLQKHKTSLLHKKKKGQIFASKKLYAIIQRWVKNEARKLSLIPSQCQALLWCEFRNTAN
jgi:hypothetical protein